MPVLFPLLASPAGGHHLSQDIIHVISPRGCFSGRKEKKEESLRVYYEWRWADCLEHCLLRLAQLLDVGIILSNLQMKKLRL